MILECRDIAMSTDTRQRILQQIDASRDKSIKFLQRMVSIPSVTGDEGEIQKFLAGYLGNMGLALDMWESDWDELKKHPGYIPVDRGYQGRPNILATWKGAGGGRSLLFNGHTDVIPVGNGEGWSDNPWSASIKDGRLYGRGSCDMKSGVASHIMAIENMIAVGLKPKGDVLLDIVIDEEVSGHGTLDTAIRGYRADAGISGETSGLAVQPACIGRIWFEIEIAGKPAGIQRRYQGVSGIELGYKVTKAVEALEQKRVASVKHPLYPKPIDALPCMIGAFHSGNFPSSFPATCLLKGSMATVPGEDHEGVKRSLVEHIARAAAEDPWMKDHPPKVRFVGYDARASEIPREHPIVQLVCKNYKEVSGRDAEISGRQGAADTRFLNLYANTPTVIFGPGSTAVMHSDDEYVDLEDYQTAIKVMALCICDWCGVETR
jgi:acetylornithine deacetylase